MADKKRRESREEPIQDESEAAASEEQDSFNISLGGAVSEGIKKLFTAGVSAAFMTEESIRSYLQDVKLPKEVLNTFVQGAAKSKEQLMNRVGNEVIAIIQKIDFVKEASKFVENHKFRISAEIEVVKKEDRSEGSPSVSLNFDKKRS